MVDYAYSLRPALLLATRAAAVLAILILFPLVLLFLLLLQFFRFPLLPPRPMALDERLVLRCRHFKKIFLRRRIALRRGKRTFVTILSPNPGAGILDTGIQSIIG